MDFGRGGVKKLFTIVDGYTLFALRCNVKSVFGKYADKSS